MPFRTKCAASTTFRGSLGSAHVASALSTRTGFEFKSAIAREAVKDREIEIKAGCNRPKAAYS